MFWIFPTPITDITLFDFREGNIVFVDNVTRPANFLCGEPMALEKGFEEYITKNKNVVCLMINDYWLSKFSFKKENGVYIRQNLSVECIKPDTAFAKGLWRVLFEDKFKEISYVHELQNIYQDWLNEKL